MQQYSSPSSLINAASGRHLKLFLHQRFHWLKLCLPLIQLSAKLPQLHYKVKYVPIHLFIIIPFFFSFFSNT
jgi:hypothetical protein